MNEYDQRTRKRDHVIPKIITVFNNKGGVGKTTLTYHLAYALGEIGKRVLLIDLDPQCNLTIFSMEMEHIHSIWSDEDVFIDDFDAARKSATPEKLEAIFNNIRTIHFNLKPTEDGTAEIGYLPPPVILDDNVGLIPGRLTLHLFEAKVGERWAGIYQGDPLSIRTATRVRSLAYDYAERYGYELVIFDTSPSLGALNRNLLSLADGFLIPCAPDLFSVYGIRNIGNALTIWRRQFESIFQFLSNTKRGQFPSKFVRFIGYTLYNARRYSGNTNPLNLAKAHYNYAQQIPETIYNFIEVENIIPFSDILTKSIGNDAVIHSHNTLPSMSQRYHQPMWRLPDFDDLEADDRSTITGNRGIYRATREAYKIFAEDFLHRLEYLDA